MLGIVIAVIVAAWTVFIGGNTMEIGFLSATGFLWVWYWIWTVVVLIIVSGIMLVTMGALTFAGAKIFGKVGGFFGFVAGGAFPILVAARVMIARALLLGGTYLLMTSGTLEMTFSQFSTSKLIFGTLLLVIGLVISKKSGS